MLPLFDMLMNAQNGSAMKDIAEKFGLDQSQMNSALEAMMPAFSNGLKRNVSSPDAMGQFMKALSSGNHSQYFENAANAFSSEGVADGNNILGHLFGSKDVSRAVAAQAEAASGVGQDIIKQLLPIIASTLMGGMFNQTNDQMKAMSGGGSGNVFGDLMGQMMGGSKGGSNPLGDMLGGMLGGASGNNQQQDNPFGKMMEGMMGNMASGSSNPFGNMFGGSQPETSNKEAANPYDELFGKMFDTGRTVQNEYQKNMDGIFDQFLGGMDKK
ncbi:DUF937 domain-containing protein [Lentilitoribacter sp. EG35]|jgi:hypothetical protein|uniref:DUF937 domain-containing protein n=1 Tax=Lentilitoribacter sp. EG35 TaxID=3234192 RepID=UPI00345F7006